MIFNDRSRGETDLIQSLGEIGGILELAGNDKEPAVLHRILRLEYAM